MDKKLVYSMAPARIPSLAQLKYIENFLNPRERLVWRISTSVFVISLLVFGASFVNKHLETLPVAGGTYTEGVVGLPKYINPLYSVVNDVDADLSQLVYSSLFKRNNQGQLTADLVQSYQAAPDGKSYLLKLRENVVWHNGDKFKVDDVIFTFNAIKDPLYKSPLRQSFSGVALEKIDDSTVRFSLSQPYAGFLDLLTFGILSQALWYQIPPNSVSLAELNLKPIGTGPYMFKSLVKDRNGNLISYHLEANPEYYGGSVHIQDWQFKFYPSFEELIAKLSDGSVDGASYLPNNLFTDISGKTFLDYNQISLPQAMAVFFNLKANPALTDQKVRQALSLAINKQELIDKSLFGNAKLIDGPISSDNFAFNPDQKKYQFDQAGATKLLSEAGYQAVEINKDKIAQAEKDKTSADKKVKDAAESILALGEGRWMAKNGSYLVIRLTSVDAGDNAAVLDAIKNYWQGIGVKTAIELVAPNQIQFEVVRNRNFESLFYGEMLGADPDIYPFWHTSQATSQGLNLTGYSNREVDKLLEEARVNANQSQRAEAYKKVQAILAEEEPAIFLYSPVYSYIQKKTVKNMNVATIIVPSDRLANVNEWYIKTSRRFKW
ncbi:peptide ABC transporter substrate-binding protein [Candidatus Falkowbacteria bacterium]|nr:peptide ABC transporter substrate-binding protein [Candidatus Falkowbacteria bacterium]